MADANATAMLERTLRVADQSCTAYAILRDKYRERALAVDILILLASTWLTSLSFVRDDIAVLVTPGNFSKDFWQGLLSITVFSFSLLQLQVNWKGRAQLYLQAGTTLSAFVKEYRPVAASADEATQRSALIRYQVLTDALEPVPESQFLSLKRRHKIKVEISTILDTKPGASITMLRVKMWLRDNFRMAFNP